MGWWRTSGLMRDESRKVPSPGPPAAACWAWSTCDLRPAVCVGCDGDGSGFVASKSADGSGGVATATAALYRRSLCPNPPFENRFDISSKLRRMRTLGTLALLTDPGGDPESGVRSRSHHKKILISQSDVGSWVEQSDGDRC